VLPLVALSACDRYSSEEWAQYRALQAREAARNTGVSIAFDPAITAIVSDNRDHRLVTDYAIDEVWRRGSSDNRASYLVQRLGVTAHCADDGMRPTIHRIGGDTFLFNNERSAGGKPEADKCVVILPGTLTRPMLRADHLEETTEIDGLPVVRVTVLVSDAAGHRYRLHALRPTLGNDDRGSMPADVLARALGLARRGSMNTTGIAAIDNDIARMDSASFATAEAKLESFLAAPFDPAIAGPLANAANPFVAITASPDRMAPYADRALTRLEEAVEAGETGRRPGEVLVPFIAAMPSASITQERRRIIALFDRPAPPDWLLKDALMQRLGEIGPAALPVAMRLYSDGDYAGALAAICQIGPAAAPASRALLLERWQEANKPETRTSTRRKRVHGFFSRLIYGRYRHYRRTYQTAATLGEDQVRLYVTMLRLGMRRDADRLARHRKADRWPSATASINADTPPTICTSDLPFLPG
jgi:hypothetical protein